jgi:hypothetical protein
MAGETDFRFARRQKARFAATSCGFPMEQFADVRHADFRTKVVLESS